MMATLRLTVVNGPCQGKRFCLRGLDACLVGWAPDCPIRFSGERCARGIGRYHCQVLLDAPRTCVLIQDMDIASRTCINGRRVGESGALAEATTTVGVARHGDIVTLGEMSLQVSIHDCAEDFPTDERGSFAEPARVNEDCPVACQGHLVASSTQSRT
jgi:hypothetical protein